jgi:hypothetical protein
MEDHIIKIEYYRHEPRRKPEKVTGNLVSFVYDIPHLPACGMFPPFHILNEILSEGGGDAGMSPGTSWKPFKLSKDEYTELWKLIEKTDLSSVKKNARFAEVKFKRDLELEYIKDRFEWMSQTCTKYREWYVEQLNKTILS